MQPTHTLRLGEHGRRVATIHGDNEQELRSLGAAWKYSGEFWRPTESNRGFTVRRKSAYERHVSQFRQAKLRNTMDPAYHHKGE